MHRISRLFGVLSCALAAVTVFGAQTPPAPTLAPAVVSDEARIANLEKLLAQTRAELAALKAASTSSVRRLKR